jgi:hypothetical protein
VHNSAEQYITEAEFLKDATHWLQLQKDVKILRVNDSYHRGYSDLILCVRGIFVALELKDNTGTPSPHQKEFIQDILLTGGIAKVVRTMKEIYDSVDSARQRSNVRLV